MVDFSQATFTDFNTTGLIPTQSSEVIPVLVNTTVETSGGLFGIGVLLMIFLILIITLTRRDDMYAMDFTRATLFGGAICLIIGLMLLAGDLISSFRHVVWFGVIFLITLIGSYYMKRKNQ